MRKRQRRITVLRFTNLSMYLVVLLMIFSLVAARGLAERDEATAALAPAMFGVSVVIDAGHGGWDPGKTSGEAIEKDINLEAAQALAEYCRAAGASVTMTRESDAALGDTKRADMEERVAMSEAAEADVFISLHCNSFSSSASQHGAQVFFKRGNAEGQLLADTLQETLVAELGNTDRVALVHDSSYLLDNIEGAAVICEMGFLSNPEERALLTSAEYRWELAWALFCGICAYLEK